MKNIPIVLNWINGFLLIICFLCIYYNVGLWYRVLIYISAFMSLCILCFNTFFFEKPVFKKGKVILSLMMLILLFFWRVYGINLITYGFIKEPEYKNQGLIISTTVNAAVSETKDLISGAIELNKEDSAVIDNALTDLFSNLIINQKDSDVISSTAFAQAQDKYFPHLLANFDLDEPWGMCINGCLSKYSTEIDNLAGKGSIELSISKEERKVINFWSPITYKIKTANGYMIDTKAFLSVSDSIISRVKLTLNNDKSFNAEQRTRMAESVKKMLEKKETKDYITPMIKESLEIPSFSITIVDIRLKVEFYKPINDGRTEILTLGNITLATDSYLSIY